MSDTWNTWLLERGTNKLYPAIVNPDLSAEVMNDVILILENGVPISLEDGCVGEFFVVDGVAYVEIDVCYECIPKNKTSYREWVGQLHK